MLTKMIFILFALSVNSANIRVCQPPTEAGNWSNLSISNNGSTISINGKVSQPSGGLLRVKYKQVVKPFRTYDAFTLDVGVISSGSQTINLKAPSVNNDHFRIYINDIWFGQCMIRSG